MHQNIASILSKRELLEITIQELRVAQKPPDVICLSETFIKKGYENYVKISDYQLAANFCREKQRGGTCILVKKDIIFKDLPYIKTYATQNTFEACGIEIECYKLLIICLYRTPNSDPTQFLSKLNNLLNYITKKYKYKMRIVIAGDFNINTLKKSNITNHLQDISYNFNMKIHIDVPTRKSSCIDHILSNIPNAIASVMPLYLSDHDTGQMLSFPVNEKAEKRTTYYIYKRDYNLDNIRKFKECLNNITWSDIYIKSDANAFSDFHELLCLFYNLCFPKVKVKVNNKNKNNQNWISKGLKKSCLNKRTLRYKYYQNKNTSNKNKYIKYSNILKKCIMNSKKNANIKYINKHENKCRATWAVIKNEIRDTNYIGNMDKIIVNNRILTQPVEIATAFNNHYINLTHETTHKHIKISTLSAPTNSMFLKPMSENEVRREIMLLTNSSSVGYDEINTKIIKECVNELTAILTHLINVSFETGTFPDALKYSIVKPLFKKGEKCDINNYRPITLIPILSKIYEKCMYRRLIDYCEKFHIISKEQYGFQKNKSTTLAVFSLVKAIVTNLNNNNLTTGLFFDISKAFDLVSHELLLKKIELVGIRGPALQWIASYLSNRQQRVIIDKIDDNGDMVPFSSEYKYNKYGVPQGSVLGPILFLLYINDIISITKHQCILFADDITIIVASEKVNNCIHNHEAEINNTIDKLIQWLDTNNLKINLNKSVYINFNKCKNPNYNIKLNITKIEEVAHTKFLGIIIDENLNWKEHVDYISKRINKFVYALQQVKNITSLKTAIMTYHAYIESLLRYGLVIWGNSTDMIRAFIAQKKCIRAMYGMHPEVSCQPIFKKLKLLPLPSLYIFEICMFVNKHKALFKTANDMNPRNRRDPQRLVLNDVPKLTKYNKSCLCNSVRIYNKLPNSIRNLNSRLFKIKLYNWLNTNNFYSLKEFMDKKH